MSQPANRSTIPRDPRVKITLRPCSLCRVEAPMALLLNVRGLGISDLVVVCVQCVIKASYELAAHKDVVINIDLPPLLKVPSYALRN